MAELLQAHAELLFFWQVCSAIPCGKVSTYGALAKALRSSPRAVGQARERLGFFLQNEFGQSRWSSSLFQEEPCYSVALPLSILLAFRQA